MAIYESVDETVRRLHNTCVLYDGRLVNVEDVKQDLALVVRQYNPSQHLVIALDDPKLEVRKFGLGYFNSSNGAAYVMRVPVVSGYKQGLHSGNLTFIWDHANQPFPWSHVMRQQGFQDMLDCKYPSIDEAVKLLKNKTVPSVAINREFAIGLDSFRGDLLMLHKGRIVGFGSAEQFVLPSEWRYLQRVTKQYGLKVA